MALQQAPAREAQRILDLARNDRAGARDLLRGLSVDEQVALVASCPCRSARGSSI